jgi:hypothetical protein
VTDEQRGRRHVFIATLWAGASWLFFRVARSTGMTQIWVLRSRLEKQPTDLRQYTCYFGDRTLESPLEMARGNTPTMEAAPRSLENLIGAGRDRQGQEFKKPESLGGLVLENPEADRRFLSS